MIKECFICESVITQANQLSQNVGILLQRQLQAMISKRNSESLCRLPKNWIAHYISQRAISISKHNNMTLYSQQTVKYGRRQAASEPYTKLVCGRPTQAHPPSHHNDSINSILHFSGSDLFSWFQQNKPMTLLRIGLFHLSTIWLGSF